VVTRTEGTTASFTKELVRSSVLISAKRESARTEPAGVREALDELLSDRDRLTRRLPGVRTGDEEEVHGGPPSGEWLLGVRPGRAPGAPPGRHRCLP
jgi:hypothetical protein